MAVGNDAIFWCMRKYKNSYLLHDWIIFQNPFFWEPSERVEWCSFQSPIFSSLLALVVTITWWPWCLEITHTVSPAVLGTSRYASRFSYFCWISSLGCCRGGSLTLFSCDRKGIPFAREMYFHWNSIRNPFIRWRAAVGVTPVQSNSHNGLRETSKKVSYKESPFFKNKSFEENTMTVEKRG